MNLIMHKISNDKKLALILFTLFFTIFLFTADGHRYSSDEDWAQKQTIKLVTLQPDPIYEQGISKQFYEYPTTYPPTASWMQNAPLCKHPLFCTAVSFGWSITEYPFVFINYHLKLITSDSVVWDFEDFQDGHYVYWRNSLDPNFTFLDVFFGPFYTAMSISIFYLISRTYNFNNKTSLILTSLLALSTTFWAFSQTSMSSVPAVFFVLLGFFLFRRFENKHSLFYLILGSSSLGFSYMIRNDMILFIIPLTGLFLIKLLQEKQKIIKLFSYCLPLSFFYFSSRYFLSLGYERNLGNDLIGFSSSVLDKWSESIFQEGILGILFSPGVGLFIFSPILLTVFFSFPDFFHKNKIHLFFFIATILSFVLYFGTLDSWHGLVSWGARYLLPIIPFMLIPLGASIEQRSNKFLLPTILILGACGFLFNIAYLIQDVSWFVWGTPGQSQGLFGLGNHLTALYIHPATIWTFEYSQLTHSILSMTENTQVDIFLYKILGLPLFLITLFLILTGHYFIIKKFLHLEKSNV